MFRNDHPTAGPNNEFTEYNPQQGTPATIPTGKFLTAMMEEVCNVIEQTGTPLDKNNPGQLWDAIQALIGPAPSGIKNNFINGAFEVAQWGTSDIIVGNPNPNRCGIDRWWVHHGGGPGSVTVSQQSFGPSDVGPVGNPVNYLRYSINVPGTGNPNKLFQRIEDVRTLSNGQACISFYARVASGTLVVTPRFRQHFGTGGSADVDFVGTQVTLTTAWAFYTSVVTIPSISGKVIGTNGSYLQASLDMPQGATFVMEVALIQLERGSKPSSYDRRTFADELLRCMRYRESSLPYGLRAPIIGGGFEEQSNAAATWGYQTITGDAINGWEIVTLGRHYRVLKRDRGSDPAPIVWHSPTTSPTANKVDVAGVARAVSVSKYSNTVHTGFPTLAASPGGGPSMCSGHWVYEDPNI